MLALSRRMRSSRSIQKSFQGSRARLGWRPLGWLLVAGCLLTANGCSYSSGSSKPETRAEAPPKSVKIAVIYYENNSPFGKAVYEGMENAAKEYKRTIDWESVPADDAEGQAGLVKAAVKRNVTGICLCPLDPDRLVAPVEAAIEAGIPVVIFERPLTEGPKIVAFAATDSFRCGELAAAELAKRMGDKGTVLSLNSSPDDPAVRQRQFGFDYEMKGKHQDITVISAAARVPASETASRSSLKAMFERHVDQADAVAALTASDSAQVQVLLGSGPNDKQDLPLIGFGVWPQVAESIANGKVVGTLLEDPMLIGYSAIMAIDGHLTGEEIGGLITTGEHLVTKEKLQDEDVRRLLESNVREDN